MKFLITGLPRSRTAWMALAANTAPNTFCYHEPLWYLPNYDALKALWQSDSNEHVGIADHALGFQLGPILRDIRPRTVIIQRDADDVIASLGQFDKDNPHFEQFVWSLVEAIEPYLFHPLVRVYRFNEIDLKIHEMMSWLCPNSFIDFAKLKQMTDFRVECEMSKVVRKLRLAKDHSQWYLPADLRHAA